MSRGKRIFGRSILAGATLIAMGGLAQAQETLKIGLLASLEGPFAAPGQDGMRGADLALKEKNGMAGGKKIEFVKVSSDATPDKAVNSTRKAVEQDNHRFLIPISVRVPVSSFMTTQEGAATKGAFSVYIATGRVVGETSDITKQTIPFTVADVEKAKDGFFTYDFDLLTDFATNRVAVGVYDEVSHDTGYARVDLYTVTN